MNKKEINQITQVADADHDTFLFRSIIKQAFVDATWEPTGNHPTYDLSKQKHKANAIKFLTLASDIDSKHYEIFGKYSDLETFVSLAKISETQVLRGIEDLDLKK